MNTENDPEQNLDRSLTAELHAIGRCTADTDNHGPVLLASLPEKRYPFVYPRDCSAACQLFRRIAGSHNDYTAAPQAFRLLAATASFILSAQGPEGSWGQRYTLDGQDASIYRQEDNTAHAVSILCNHLLTADRIGEDVTDRDAVLQAVDRGLQHALDSIYRPELNLFESTTAIHESALESGYTLWTNLSYLYAFSLAAEVQEKGDRKGRISGRITGFRKEFLYSANELFMEGDRYVRRMSLKGEVDRRPDVTLLSPFWYGFLHHDEALRRSVGLLYGQLQDPELGMIMRYLPFAEDPAVHIHAGNGPWLQYTAMLAQYLFWEGRTEEAQHLLDRIDSYRDEDGGIPEHLSTPRRFEDFMEREWQTGRDYQKEFDDGILLPGIGFERILAEANKMSVSYAETAERHRFPDEDVPGGGHIRFVTPLMWSHVEYARALMVRDGDWWKLWK